MGMYQYDNTLFDLFSLPDEMKDKRQDIINSICIETQELEILYPSIPFLQTAIGNWSNTMQSVWKKLYKTTVLEYNPIENYDRTDDTTESVNTKENENVTENITRNDTLNNTTDNTGNSEMINQNVAFNNTDFSNNEKTMNSIDNNITETGKNKYDTDRSLENGKTMTNSRTITNRSHGNIGVTTSQQMIEQERQISEFSIVKYIVDDFKQKFCLMIY